MAFKKDKVGLVLFFFSIFMIFLQFWVVYLAIDPDENTPEGSYLFYHKMYFYFLAFMTLWCLFRCACVDPGMITHKNNTAVIEFYLNIHDIAVKRAEKFNEAYGDVFFKNLSEDEEFKQAEDDDEEYSDYDDTHYEPVTSVPDESIIRINQEYKIEFKRCSQCYVARPPRVHHCSMCKGCIMKMDHHCPWVNNCIGQFTQKFFILFCIYSLSGCLETALIELYYMLYKHKQLTSTWGMIILTGFQVFFGIIFIIFTICMINDEWNIIQNDTTMIDVKKRKFL
ncbi:MAG: DHHC family palmitoyltransferase, partial [archaeon]|nr:DHHC family palmitoyltransferase [archaeon]